MWLQIAVGVFIGILGGGLAAPLGQSLVDAVFEKPDIRMRVVPEKGWIDRTEQARTYRPTSYGPSGWSEVFRVQVRNLGSLSAESILVTLETDTPPNVNPGALRNFHSLEIFRAGLLWDRSVGPQGTRYLIDIVEPGEIYEARYSITFFPGEIEKMVQDNGSLKLRFTLTDGSRTLLSEELTISLR